jgi:hypothetical protein
MTPKSVIRNVGTVRGLYMLLSLTQERLASISGNKISTNTLLATRSSHTDLPLMFNLYLVVTII